ncbi:Ribose-phosphate pyrophosphokinase [Bienertia sinuspersici]
MATTLFLTTPLIHPSRYGEVSGTTISKLSSSIFRELVKSPSLVQKGITQSCRNKSLSITSLFGRKVKAKSKRETVVPDPDYRIPIVLLGATGALVYTDNLLAAMPVGLLGLLLVQLTMSCMVFLFQATRVKFVFDDEALEVKEDSELNESEQNVFVGGKNRWKYSTFVNWEFWWPNFPILVYFKETQTKLEGQIHFFPIIFNGKQLYDVMVERAGSSETSSPKTP